MDRKIDFLIIGAQKAGTTSLHDLLAQHPAIYMPEKDLQFFLDADDYTVPVQDFPLYYSGVRPGQLIGGSQVQLLFSPESPHKVFEYRPATRIVAVLRNPIDRAYSAFWFARRKAWDNSTTFEEALEREQARTEGAYRERADLTYLSHGHYAEQLERWFALMPRSQIFIGLFDDLRSNSSSFASGVIEWLGVGGDLPELHEVRSNASARPRFGQLQKLLSSPPAFIRKPYKAVMPKRIQIALQRSLVRPLTHWNELNTSNPPMAEETRERLRDYFAPHNERLEKLIDVDLSHWY